MMDADDSGDDSGMGALEVTELIDGILVGALKIEHVDSLETCVTDINPLMTHMMAAVADFEDGSFSKIASGIEELGDFITEVGTSMEDCAKISADDVAKLKAMGEAFTHPQKMIIASGKYV